VKFEITKQEGNMEIKLEVKVWLIKLLTTVGASSGIPYVLNYVIKGKNHLPWQVVSFPPRIIFQKVASATAKQARCLRYIIKKKRMFFIHS
jgi:hypothetical protein